MVAIGATSVVKVAYLIRASSIVPCVSCDFLITSEAFRVVVRANNSRIFLGSIYARRPNVMLMGHAGIARDLAKYLQDADYPRRTSQRSLLRLFGTGVATSTPTVRKVILEISVPRFLVV